jgi:hypothetical protein
LAWNLAAVTGGLFLEGHDMTNGNSNDYGPSFRLARLFRKQSKAGQTYFSGRMGFGRVTVLKSKEVTEDGAEIWNLVVSEAPQQKQEDRPASGSPELRANYTPPANGHRGAAIDKHLDDEIPF